MVGSQSIALPRCAVHAVKIDMGVYSYTEILHGLRQGNTAWHVMAMQYIVNPLKANLLCGLA